MADPTADSAANPFQKLQQDHLTFELGGEAVKWDLNGLSAKLAKQRGYEPGQLLREVNSLLSSMATDPDTASTEDILNSFQEQTEAVARLVWYGCLGFYEGLKYEDVLRILTRDTMADVPVIDLIDEVVPGFKGGIEKIEQMSEEELEEMKKEAQEQVEAAGATPDADSDTEGN